MNLRKKAIFASVIMIMVSLFAVVGASARSTVQGGKYYRIRHYSGYYLEVPANNLNNDGARVKLARKGSINQIFYVLPCNNSQFMLVNFASGRALEVTGASNDNDAQVGQWAVDVGAYNQRWYLKGGAGNTYAYLINSNSGKAMDIPYAYGYSGQDVNQYEFNGCDAQKFAFEPVSTNELSQYVYMVR